MKKYLLLLLVAGPAFGADIDGVLLERGTKIPLKEVNIFILPHKLKSVTDAKGEFHFSGVPEGEFTWVINQTGYDKLEVTDDTKWTDHRKIYLEKTSYIAFETKIVSQKEKRDESGTTMDANEFMSVPGAGGDPVKAVQNLPGVNHVAGFSAVVVIQGSAPEDTQYELDGHEIPIAFHFGGLTSVVIPESIKSVTEYSAGYDVFHSKALGGILSLDTRDPDVGDRDKKGFFFVDNLKSGGMFEKKLSDHESLLVGGRLSYIGFFLRAVAGQNSDFDLTVAPEFSDFTLLYKNKISETDDFKLDLVGSRDVAGFLLKQPLKTDPGLRGTFHDETDFWRVIPQWQHKIDADTNFLLSAGLGQDVIQVDIGDDYLNIKSNVVSLRSEYDRKLSSMWRSQLGIDTIFSASQVGLQLPVALGGGSGVSNPVASAQTQADFVKTNALDFGLYSRNEVQLTERWMLLPGLRLDHHNLTDETLLSPRVGLDYKWDDSLKLVSATGIYYQPPQPQESNAQIGNPDIRSPRAYHFKLGFEKDFRENRTEGTRWNAAFFRRDFSHLVVATTDTVTRNGVTVPEYYDNSGGGVAQGIETQIHYDEGTWNWVIAYTLSKSQRWDPQHPVYNFQYDQTHNLNVIASHEYGKNWKFAGRYRYVTGDPYTPVVGGVFDADNDVYLPIRGAYYSDRLGAFSQLDLRFDKKWILDTEVWSIYFDIQNVLNTKNAAEIRYSYDYSQKTTVNDLPFLPAIGLKGEF